MQHTRSINLTAEEAKGLARIRKYAEQNIMNLVEIPNDNARVFGLTENEKNEGNTYRFDTFEVIYSIKFWTLSNGTHLHVMHASIVLDYVSIPQSSNVLGENSSNALRENSSNV